MVKRMGNRKAGLVLLTMFAVIAVSVMAWAKTGDRNATGRITSAKANAVLITVAGRTEKGYLWLGCTIRYEDGTEKDRDVKKVKGKFSKTFSSDPIKWAMNEVDSVVVALWRWKVSSKECAKNRGGTACEYCRKNGYHMEDRIHSTKADME